MRSTIAAAIVVVAALPILPGGALALAADPPIKLVERTPELRAGDRASVVARVQRVDRCRLALGVKGAATVRSAIVSVEARERISWRWRVSSRTGAGSFTGSILCWHEPLPKRFTLESADVAEPFDGRLHGGGPRPRLVDHRGISAAVTPVAGDDRPAAEKLGNWASVAGAVIALIGLPAVAVGLWLTRLQLQSEETRGVVERYTKTEYRNTWAEAMGVFSARDEAHAVEKVRCWEAAKTNTEPLRVEAVPGEAAGSSGSEAAEPPEKDSAAVTSAPAPPVVSKGQVVDAANLYEDIAALWNIGKLDKRQVLRTFGSVMPQALEASWWWVHYQREGMRAAARLPVVRDGETHWFSEWELMVRAMARRDRRLQEQTLNPDDLDDRVRALLLPRNFTSTGGELTKQDDEWGTREWTAYGELSRAVADVLNAPDGEHRLRAALGGSPPSPAVHRTPERTVLIPRWRPYLRQPWLFVRWIYSLGSRLERSRLPVLASAGGWIADRDRRVAYHTRLHALAALLDCKINEARSPEKVLELVRSA